MRQGNFASSATVGVVLAAAVKGRLRLLIESESLLNDGTAAVAFVATVNVLAGEHQDVVSIVGALLLNIGGGILIGAVVGFGFMLLAGRTADYLVEITLTTLAALTAGLVVGNYRPSGTPSEAGRHALETFWEYVAFLVNSLIFILIGLQEAEQHFKGLWLPVLAAIVLVTVGRAVAIYPLCAVFARGRLKVETQHQHILVWGGLRGALALALALALPDSLPHRDTVVTITFAVVAFSVFAQGLTITPLLRRLGQIQ